jgi:DNA replication licensing factor MCM2
MRVCPGILRQDEATMVNLEDLTGSIRDLLSMENVKRAVYARFRNFLCFYTDNTGMHVYVRRIIQLAQDNRESLEVSHIQLRSYSPHLADWLCMYPAIMLAIFDKVAMQVVLVLFPNYRRIQATIHVRFNDTTNPLLRSDFFVPCILFFFFILK